MLKILSDLNRQQEARIAAASGDSKAGYVMERDAAANADANNNEKESR